MQTGYVLRDIASPHFRAPVQDTSDEALIGLIADGDKRAMQVLYARHNVRVYRFIVRLTGNQSLAEDLVSEVFLDVWRQAEGFESKSQVSTWLLAIARYKALSALRRRTDEHLDDHMAETIEDTSDDPETMVNTKDRNTIVQKCGLLDWGERRTIRIRTRLNSRAWRVGHGPVARVCRPNLRSPSQEQANVAITRTIIVE